jgi:hypothetical protein
MIAQYPGVQQKIGKSSVIIPCSCKQKLSNNAKYAILLSKYRRYLYPAVGNRALPTASFGFGVAKIALKYSEEK